MVSRNGKTDGDKFQGQVTDLTLHKYDEYCTNFCLAISELARHPTGVWRHSPRPRVPTPGAVLGRPRIWFCIQASESQMLLRGWKTQKRILKIMRHAKRADRKYNDLEEEINEEFRQQKIKTRTPFPPSLVTNIPATEVLGMIKVKREDRSVGRKH
ncbi:uncharacterized protein BJX67DRAFT_356743 [Aspergillus lucknowensis]|uniref:Uncharacterized protein n=1 Tax=Aspergillus lucknowensis TaxID=176173 RepID=A0ABR4LMZ2_9EURO